MLPLSRPIASAPAGRPVTHTLVATGLRDALDSAPPGTGVALARSLGWSPQLLSNVKAGRRRVRDEDAADIAAFLSRTQDDLFARADVPNVPTHNPDTTSEYPELAGYPMVLTIQEVAAILRVSRNTVRDRCLNGSIQHITLGNRRRIPRAEVARLLSAATT